MYDSRGSGEPQLANVPEPQLVDVPGPAIAETRRDPAQGLAFDVVMRVILRTPGPITHGAAVAGAEYVLCDHGYLRMGWCDECRTGRTQTDVFDLSVLLYPAIVMVFGLFLTYVLAPAVLVNLAALLSLAVVVNLGWIVVRRDVRPARRGP